MSTSLKVPLFKLLSEANLDAITKKQVRRNLETALEMPVGSLDARKGEISTLVAEFLAQHNPEEAQEETKEDKKEPKKVKKETKQVTKKKKTAKRARSPSPSSDSGSGSDSSSDSSDSDTRSSKKKKKKAKTADKPKPKATIKRPGDALPPKGLIKRQSSLMRRKKFMRTAPVLETTIFGNELTGPPRTFEKSGNVGWWTGGKVPVAVDGKTIWCQLTCSLVACGSKNWDD